MLLFRMTSNILSFNQGFIRLQLDKNLHTRKCHLYSYRKRDVTQKTSHGKQSFLQILQICLEK